MKKIFLKLLSLCLILAALLSTGVGCSDIQTSAAVSYGSGEISKAIFQYLCCTEKTTYLFEVYGLDSNTYSASQLQDNAAIWTAQAADGTTVADDLKSRVLQKVQIYLYMQQYAKNKGYSLSAQQLSAIQAEFDSTISSFESKDAFNKQMAQYGVDYDQLLLFNQVQSLAWQGNELLFGEGGSMEITKDSAKRYFDKNYITMSCIFINTKNKTYPNGKVVVLPEEEKAEKKKLAETLLSRLQAGEDFASLAKEYSDLSDAEKCAESGYTFEKGGFVSSAAEEKGFALNEGEIAAVETAEGVYLIRRDRLNQDFFSETTETIRTKLEEAKKLSLILDELDQFEMDEDFLNSLDIATLPHLV